MDTSAVEHVDVQRHDWVHIYAATGRQRKFQENLSEPSSEKRKLLRREVSCRVKDILRKEKY